MKTRACIQATKTSKNIIEVRSKVNGYVEKINTIELGNLSVQLGAGRARKEDSIDYSAGIIVNKKPGDKVEIGELIATLYTNKDNLENIEEMLLNAYTIVNHKTEKLKVIEEVVK